MKSFIIFSVPRIAVIGLLSVGHFFAPQVFAQPSQKPLFITGSAPPAVLLTVGRDHKLYYEAYNDASDIDGDGTVDVGFKPDTITYYGLFDSYKCYSYDGNAKYFVPVSNSATKKCRNLWSGDFLNYTTTTRIDAVRKVLYGGMRVVDTATDTVIERAYIPQDSHSFGKEYRSSGNGYSISDYAPLSQPASGKNWLFASVTMLVDRSRNDLTAPPLLRVLNSDARVWQWLSKERPVADNSLGNPTDYVVRVKVCVDGLLEQNCAGYPEGKPTTFKPTGVLHEYGGSGQMYFGLITGSYDNQKSGGVLRKNMSNFADEIDINTGQFLTNVKGIVYNINRFRVYGFGNWYYYDCGWDTSDPTTSNQNCEDWSNPVGEMMYEGLRYFSGKLGPTPAYVAKGSSKDSFLGLTNPAWKDPFKSASNPNGLPYCSKPVQMVISDLYASFDSDELPGTSFGTFAGDLPGLNVTTIANTISSKEGIAGNYFIGDSLGTPYDKVSSPKPVSGFGTIRGLAPDEPTRGGSYYSAAVAHYGKGTDLRKDLADKGWAQTVDTYSVAIASPLPKIQIPVGTGSNKKIITMIPFAKSVGGGGISAAQNAYQPTNQLVDFYVERIVNQDGFPSDPSVNGGRASGRFRINWEDVEQGADHDMDAIAIYEYNVKADGTVEIEVNSEYAAGGMIQHMGYIISGTTADKMYLEVRDDDTCQSCDPSYYLDTPPTGYPFPGLTRGRLKGEMPAIRTFTPGTTTASFIPHDPLWYAAKYGGYPDKKNADRQVEATGVVGNVEPKWDSTKTGEPDNYFLVTNAAKLSDQLRVAFSDIQSKAGSATLPASGSSVLNANSRSFEASYSSADWTGIITASKVNLDGSTSQLWVSSDATLFPTAFGARKIFTIWNNAVVNFSTTQSPGLPLSAATAFNISNLYSVLQDDPTMNWATLPTSAKQALAFTTLVDYVRGDKSREKKTGAKGTLRTRNKLLGDIINSNVVYAAQTNFGFDRLPATEGSTYPAWLSSKSSAAYQTIYVGANDGMLHAFAADTGAERFSFVPSSVFGKLYKYATDLPHEYYVDGRLTLSDAYRGGSWTSVVLGSTGAGGRSVFALDVGSPTGTTSNIMWEFKDAKLGYPIGSPQIARTSGKSGRWVAIFANGYYSLGLKAKLFVVDLFSGSLLKRIDLKNPADTFGDDDGSDGNNGLGSVGIGTDLGMIHTIAAGDLKGNLWKIDASDTDPSNWKIANSGLPLVKVTDPNNSNQPQPITAEPSIARIQSGGQQIFFGTGKLIDDDDRASTDVQSIYSVWLKADPGKTLTRADLLQQKIEAESVATARGLNARFVSANVGTGKEWGWFLDLKSPSGPATGERILAPLHYLLGYVNFNTWFPPESDPCLPGNSGWGMTLSADNGSVTEQSQFDINGDGRQNSNDKVNGRYAAGLKTDPGTSAAGLALTVGSKNDQSQRGAQLQPGGNGTCPAGLTLIDGRCVAPQPPGTCAPCNVLWSSGKTTECRPYNCGPQSWVQLQ